MKIKTPEQGHSTQTHTHRQASQCLAWESDTGPGTHDSRLLRVSVSEVKWSVCLYIQITYSQQEKYPILVNASVYQFVWCYNGCGLFYVFCSSYEKVRPQIKGQNGRGVLILPLLTVLVLNEHIECCNIPPSSVSISARLGQVLHIPSLTLVMAFL